MGARSSKSPKISRRGLFAGAVAPAFPSLAPIPLGLHPFEAWRAERQLLERALDNTPEEKEPLARERLLDRIFELESLILSTPSSEFPAIRVKAAVLLWLMEMESADGLPAMRHIHAYLESLA